MTEQTAKWHLDDDVYIVAFSDHLEPAQLAEDLGRSEDAVQARITFLRDSGAWTYILIMLGARREVMKRAGHAPHAVFSDVENVIAEG